MRLEISCFECLQDMAPGESRIAYSRLCSLSDDGVYEFECPNGHRTTTVLRTPKHEVLYTIGANAILDGYLREAVASFAASLERYYEFVLRVVARHRNVAPQEFDNAWKILSKQSERQFGAFVIAWFLETGKHFTSSQRSQINKMTELRNHVIHQGKIPTASECKNYGQHVLDIAAPVEKILLNEYGPAHKDECFANARKVKSPDSSLLTVLSIFSVFENAKKNDWKLEPALKRLNDYREHLQIPETGTDSLRKTMHKRVDPDEKEPDPLS